MLIKHVCHLLPQKNDRISLTNTTYIVFIEHEKVNSNSNICALFAILIIYIFLIDLRSKNNRTERRYFLVIIILSVISFIST